MGLKVEFGIYSLDACGETALFAARGLPDFTFWMQSIDLSNNQLTGTIPVLWRYKVMESVDLGSNRLS